MSQMDAKEAEETWTAKDEIASLERMVDHEWERGDFFRNLLEAKIGELNALQQQLADLKTEHDFAQEELAKTGALYIRAAVERDRYREALERYIKSCDEQRWNSDAEEVEALARDALISPSPIAPEEEG